MRRLLDGRSVARLRLAAGIGGELRAEIDGSCSGGWGMASYKQGWADERAGRQASRRPKSSQNLAILARSIQKTF